VSTPKIVNIDAGQVTKPRHIGFIQAQVHACNAIDEPVCAADDIDITAIHSAIHNKCYEGDYLRNKWLDKKWCASVEYYGHWSSPYLDRTQSP
jgi:hypothetical protein